MEMDADALKNEVQKQVVEGRQMVWKHQQEQLWCEGTVILSSRSMVDRRHINNRSVKRRISRSRGVLRGRS